MNVSLPASAFWDIASSTSGFIKDFATPAEFVIGVLLALLVIEVLIYSLLPVGMKSEL